MVRRVTIIRTAGSLVPAQVERDHPDHEDQPQTGIEQHIRIDHGVMIWIAWSAVLLLKTGPTSAERRVLDYPRESTFPLLRPVRRLLAADAAGWCISLALSLQPPHRVVGRREGDDDDKGGVTFLPVSVPPSCNGRLNSRRPPCP